MPPRRRTGASQTVTRNIHFYRADTGYGNDGYPVPLDVDAVLTAVHSRPFTSSDQGGRYLAQDDGEDLCAWVDAEASPQRLRLARLRRNALPQAEMAGQLSDVALARGAALYEAVHLLFLPDNVIGAKVQLLRAAPHPAARLPCGARRCSPNTVRDRANPAPGRRRPARPAERPAAVGPEGPAVLRGRREAGGPEPRRGAAPAAGVGEADVVGVVLQAEPRTRSARLGQGLLSGVRRLARRSDLRDNASRFAVNGIGPDGLVEKINVLSDALVSVQQVARLGRTSRAVDQDSAYAAIEAAYREASQGGLLDGPGVSEVQG